MPVRNTVAASALAGLATLLGCGNAAYAGSTRNWTGAWIGFGAGYAGSSSNGQLRKSEGCFTSSMASSGQVAGSSCTVGGGQATTRIDLGLSDSVIAAPVIAESNTNISGTRSYTLSDIYANDGGIPATIAANSIVEANASPRGMTVASSSVTAGPGGITADGNAFAESSGPTSTSVNSYIFEQTPSSATVVTNGIAAANAISGVYGAASHSAAKHDGSSAEAVAIGFGGLPQGDLSGTDGGLSPDIHLRYDYQTPVNVIIGAELDLAMYGGEGVDQSSQTSIDPNDLLRVERGFQAQTDALLSARLRLGYAMGNYMAYATGGLAYTDFTATAYTNASYDGQTLTDTSSKSDSAFGAVVGGGISTFVADNATVSLEGLYYKFGKEIQFGESTEKTTVKLDDALSVMMKFSIRVN